MCVSKAMWFFFPRTQALGVRKGKTSGRAWSPSKKSQGLTGGKKASKKAK